MTSLPLNKLVVIGVGLIGGSFALALRHTGMVKQIVGIGRSQKNMQRAVELGVIDEIASNPAAALKNADFVLLAMPVGQTSHIMAQIAPCLESETIISDVGSTKQDVITAARTHLTRHLTRFIPSHPIAGTEFSGAEAASTHLFLDKHLIITPLTENSEQAISLVTALWQHCGAKVSCMPADQHDRILAIVSHLPHILAFTLMNHVHANIEDKPEEVLRFAGSSFRDCTRIASSSPEMWRDICLANQETLLKQIDVYQNKLSDLRTLLANNDGEALEKTFLQARETRQQWLESNQLLK
ncbi:prephenate dehydrogenase/arogenate dehydrogenase family protein [Nitrosomonas communis]|uniref:prephenate dehydrogenase n=1 Tax=Nitrosomonas communis TaxID=44574 RepID=UPI0026F1B0FA|nr:prephenate dehydrogenase/arogenate dehydrogenase family protein [Nitrosomonas communis]MCO6426998.1 prephenate dehydrogenase/arogenate dehydrogenase family protein [Nitrosomonas communis]